jgi:hypothetical protein
MNRKVTRSYLKKRILVQYQGRTELQAAGIHGYVEDLKRGPNAEIGPKDFFEMASNMLDWPEEIVASKGALPKWGHQGSNFCLDFHGDPVKAQVVVFSDGNHHMALLEALEFFQQQHSKVEDIFYAALG